MSIAPAPESESRLMSMIACPECGLPRSEDQIGVVPCPVCADRGTPRTPGRQEPLAVPPDPIAGLPADVSELQSRAAVSQPMPLRTWSGLSAAFVLGVAAGVGGLFAWQAAYPVAEPTQIAQLPPLETVPLPEPIPPRVTVAIAPPPHAPRPEAKSRGEPEPSPMAQVPPKLVPRPPVVAHVVNLNQPEATYNVEPAIGEHLVLRGKVRMLRVTGLEAGAILDASGLEAGSIYVGGKIDGGSILKLNAPESVVAFTASVLGRSQVDIHAPGGDVRFAIPTEPDRPGSLIDGGSNVTILARNTDLRGDVAGLETRVRVTLTKNGSLRVAAVRGAATVEYRGDERARVTADVVGPGASFRKFD